jgi:putative ABC transport system permease protein
MRPLRSLARGLRALTQRRDADQDIDDEVRHYLDQATAAHRLRGLSPDDARRAALLEIGNASVVAEQVRSFGWENVVETLLADLRYGARWLRANPGFTAVSAITLALGIGATTAIFSAVYPILFEPLPYPNADRIVAIRYSLADGSRGEQAFGTFREILTRSRAFDALAVMRAWQPTMTGPAEPERFDGQRVSAAYFRVLGVRPAIGREFDPADDHPNGSNVVIISNALWRRRLNADSAIVGRQIRLDDRPYTVLGVMPPGFVSVMSPTADVWSLLQYDPSLPPNGREWGHHLRMFGRLRAGVGIAQAALDLDAIAHTRVPEFSRPPYASMERGLPLTVLQRDIVAAVRPALLGVLGAVVLVLIIACVNVTNLLLARGAQRRGEFAMRAVLGAGRARLTRQLLTESLLLAMIGGAAGIGVATIGVRALLALRPPDLPRADAIGLHGVVFLFALAATTLIGLAVGVVPALHASRHDLQATLQQASRRAPRQVTRRVLVVAEVSLALVLLAGAGLLLQSLERLFAITPGFNSSHLLTMQVQASGRRLDDAGTRRFFADALDAVKRVPGVEAAAFTSELPLSGEGQLETYGVTLEHAVNPAEPSVAFRYAVTPGYFEAMGIPLRRGRLFDAGDLNVAPARPVLVNESFAKRKFPDQDAIGQRVRAGGSADRPWDVIVGVVGDVKQLSLAATQSDAIYATTAQWLWADQAQWLIVRAREDAASLTAAVRSAVWSVDKDEPVVHATTMDALVAASEAQRRFVLIVFEAFAVVALALAATGIYGVLSGSVSERIREIGVRSALGATRGSILGLIVRQGMTLTVIGAGIGLAGAVVASRALETLLFGISRVDAQTYAGVTALLLGVSMVACWLPAWRAARLDPAITLRAE